MAINKLDQTMLTIEEGLGTMGWFPVIGQASAVCRGILGTAQIICGLAVAAFSFLAGLLANCLDKQSAEEWFELCGKSFNYVGHGLLNNFRAFVEFKFFILGGFACYLFDDSRVKVLKYPTEPNTYTRNRLIG